VPPNSRELGRLGENHDRQRHIANLKVRKDVPDVHACLDKHGDGKGQQMSHENEKNITSVCGRFISGSRIIMTGCAAAGRTGS
jgi:hypothetical protein